MAQPVNPDAEVWQRWKNELDFAQKDKKYTTWLDRSEKIVKRYRDERENPVDIARRKMNILWSNVETLRPAIYARMPKPMVERRFMDRDPAARLASTILERALQVQMEAGYFHKSVGQAVLDHLLPGMGQVWLRYEPKIEQDVEAAENAKIDSEEKTAREIEEDGDGEPYEKIAYEKVCVDYVHYRDFLWGAARFWNEVPWVARRSWLSRSEIAEKFFGGDVEKAKVITLDYTPDRAKDKIEQSDSALSFFKKAEIYEIWNKADQTVYFIAPGTPDVVLKQEKNPVLKLEGFWPCPMPLFATQTNETLVPVPDYVEYQDQAAELDDLTARISALTTALRVNGVYDSSVPALARLLQDGQDNKLVPVDQWAAFAEKGGMPGAISLIPIKEIADVLIGLYAARVQVKADMFEVNGLSDIVRGQASGGQKTATEQRIKGQFASMRLEDRRSEVARFCRDTLAIQAEIISEMFSDEILLEMSGVGLMIQDDVRKAVEDVPQPPPPPQPPEGQQVDPQQMQMMQMQAQQAHQQAQQAAAQAAQQKGMEEFQQALQILRSDKLRGFRVDIETDSTIAVDLEEDKKAATELVTSTLTGLQSAGEIIMQAPELIEPIGGLLMFAFRRFRVGRTLESKLEEALDKLEAKIETSKNQPPPPSPEQIKAQAEMEKMKMQAGNDQQKHQLEMQGKQADFQMEQQRNAMELEKMRAELEIERERLEIEREKMAIQERSMMLKAQVDTNKTAMQADANAQSHAMAMEEADHSHRLGMETMDAKAQAAQQQAKAKPKEKA